MGLLNCNRWKPMIGLGLWCLIAPVPLVLGMPQPPAIERIDEADRTALLKKLVSELSSSQFLVREKATERLSMEFGERNLPQLQEQMDGLTDPESKARLGSVIARLKTERLENQIRDFKRSRNPKETFGFDGWTTFSRYAGTSKGAKDLFLMLLDRFPELVEKPIESKEAASVLAKRMASIVGESFGELKPPGFEPVLALIYCVSASEELTDPGLERICLRAFKYFEFANVLVDNRYRKALEPMFNSWALGCKDVPLNCLMFAMEKDLPVAHELAIKMLQTPAQIDEEYAFLFAMQALYRYGKAEDLELVSRWLDDKTECVVDDRNDAAPFTIQRRDAALLTAMRLTGDDLQSAFPSLAPHGLTGYVAASIFLPKPEDEFRTKRVEDYRKRRQAEKKSPA
jgi:hypothetical protein